MSPLICRSLLLLAGSGLALVPLVEARGQTRQLPRNTRHLLDASGPPGQVAQAQAYGNRPAVGSLTGVSIIGPTGLKIGLAQHGQFLDPIDAPVTTGMLVGAVYRFRVTNIPDWAGEELYPTLEIIDRVNPEPRIEHRFPISVVLTQDDLLQSLQGALVTRVIYLEDSDVAAPFATKAGEQMSLDVGPTTNALRAADELGRPVAILRIGSRVPTDLTGDLSEFLYGCPPWVPMSIAPNRDALIRQGQIPDMMLTERTDAIYSEPAIEKQPREPLHEAGGFNPSSQEHGFACPDCGVCGASSSCGHECHSMPCPGERGAPDPNEHVFDGGDRDPRAVVKKDWSAAGIGPNDTLVYYETAGGKVCIHPSNRVAIYAPRFGAIRQVTGAVVSANALAPGRVHSPLGPEAVEEQNRIAGMTRNATPNIGKQIQRLDRFRLEQNPTPIDRVVQPTPMTDAVAALINVDVSATDLAARREGPAMKGLTYFVQTRYLPESVAVLIGDQPAVVMTGTKQPSEVVLYEIPDRCSIRITKSASHTSAEPGELIRFTIRFENVGPNRVENVVIVDSLNSRLEYIGGTQQSSADARFSSKPNEVGSSELRWEIGPDLAVGEGGVISFDCRVR